MDGEDTLYGLDPDKDQALLDAVASDAPPDPAATPVPDLPETEIVEPPAPYIGEGPAAPVDLDAIAAAPAPVPAAAPGAIPGATKMPKDASISPGAVEQQRDLDKQTAEINAATAERTAAVAQEQDDNDRLAYADYLERRKAGEDALATATKAAQKAELVDPRSKTPGWRSALAVIFGGLGAGMSAAGGGDATNRGLQTLTKKWDDDLELQKANIGRLKDNVVMARTGLRDMDDARQVMRIDANARTLGRYNLAIKQGEAQLRKLGVPAADIAADQRLAALRAARAAVEAQAHKDADAHALNQARIEAMRAKAERLKRPGTGGGSKAERAAREKERFDRAKEKEDREREVYDAATGESVGQAPSASRAATASKRLELLDVVRGDAERLKEHIDTIGSVAPRIPLVGNVTDASRTRDALANKLVTDVSGFQNLGAISKDDKKIIDGVIGGGAPYVLGLNSKQIDELLGALSRAKDSALRTQGIKPAEAAKTEPAAKPQRAAAPSKDQDTEAVQWAKANKSDPRAREILRANGVR